MRVLVTGAGGQLGSDLVRLLPSATAVDRATLAIEDAAAVRAAVAGHDLVLNCAAHNAVDGAESDPGPAWAVNATGVANLAAACAAHGARLVHFSTNFVFDGEAAEPYAEGDPPAPRSVYALSKLEGERRALELPGALVVRSAGLYGRRGSAVKGGSFPERILRRAWSGQPLRVVDDQLLNPTATADLAAATLGLVEGGLTGVVHLVNSGCASWHEFAVETVRLAGLDLEVARVGTAELGAAAARPRNGCLRSTRVEAMRPWPEALAEWAAAFIPAAGAGRA